jgi:hypothetical protein
LRHLANNSATGSLKLGSDFRTSAAHFTNAGYMFTYSVSLCRLEGRLSSLTANCPSICFLAPTDSESWTPREGPFS